MTRPNVLLSLDDAAARLDMSRKELSAHVTTLGIQKQRGEDRRSYLAPIDVERIASFKKEQKANPAFQSLIMYGVGDQPQPMTMQRNVKAYIDDAYCGSDTIFKVVNYVSQNGAAIPPKLYSDRTMSKEITSHPLLDRLAQPNPEQDGVLYREAVLGWYLITGNSFQLAIRPGKTKGPPDELWTLEVNKVHPDATKKRGVIDYIFDDYPKEMNPIPMANIGHLRSWNPKSPVFGLSPIEVGALIVDQQTASRKWNLALLQNWARLPGAWVTPPGVLLSPNDRKKLEDKINEKFAGARNAGRFPVLDGGMTWQNMAVPPTEMDWLESLRVNGGALANLYNIPPPLIGDTSASTYNNMEEAKAASYTEAIFPANDKMYSLWNSWLVPMYPDLCDKNGKPTAYLYYDKTTVEVVQAVIQSRLNDAVKRANQAWMQGTCTLDEARAMQGLPPLPNGDGQVYRFGAVLVPADKLMVYALQSMKIPAAPPMPVPENILDAPAPTQQGNEPSPGEKRLRKAKDDKEEEHTGVMVAFFLDPASAKKLAIADGEPAKDLHVTLAYLGEQDDLDFSLPALKKTLASFASEAGPLTGTVSGVGRFTSVPDDELTPIYASVDIPGLSSWRETLVKQLTDFGLPPDATHGFTPHITLDYVNADEEMPLESVPALELTFDTLTLAIGNERYTFALGDEDEEIAEKARFTPQEKAALLKVRERLLREKKLAPATHKTWDCAPGACAFCLQNDGVTVGIDDEFPNGCSSPDDCHKWCRCSAYELALPDDVNPDDHTPSFLIAVYAVGFIASRHERDVEAQQQEQHSDDGTGDGEDYAKTTRIETARERKRRKEEFQQFTKAVLV